MIHSIHPEADAEFTEAIRYYATIDLQLGVEFYREVERAVEALRLEQSLGAVATSLRDQKALEKIGGVADTTSATLGFLECFEKHCGK